MRIARLIQKRLRESAAGTQVDADVNAVVAANVGGQGQVTKVSSTQADSASSHSEKTESPGSAGA